MGDWALGIGITLIVFGVGVGAVLKFVLMPYWTIQAKRRISYQHRPQKNEMWYQDGDPFYIYDTNITGVEILTVDPDTRQVHHWKDTWEDWDRRLQVRTVIFSGQSRQLKEPS